MYSETRLFIRHIFFQQIKQAEKHGTRHARPSVLDGIPRHLPALLRAEKLVKKARKGKLLPAGRPAVRHTKSALGKQLFALTEYAQSRGWSAEELLRREALQNERALRRQERAQAARQSA